MGSIASRLATFVMAALVTVGCKRTPYSSPTALRDTNAYVKAISPAPPGSIDQTLLDQATVGLEGGTLRATNVSRSNAGDASDGFHHVVKRLGPGEKLVGEGASFEMVAFSVSGPGISKTPTPGKKSVPLEYFAPDGKSLTPEELTAMGFKKWQLEEYLGNSSHYLWDSYPEVKVWFGPQTQPPGYITPAGLFDARTKHGLVGGHSYAQISSNSFGFSEVRPHAWHAAPMELVMDVELDGRTVVETNAAPGITVAMPGGLVRMLGIWSGHSGSWSSSSGSAPGTQVIEINLQDGTDSTNSVALFVTEPVGLAVHFELLGEHGRVFEGNGGGTSGGMRVVEVRARAEDVKQVRCSVFTNHYRVVIPVPPIPNLPAAGQNATNLFEVTVPLATLQREDELRELVRAITQMNFRYPPGGDLMPTNLFPMALTNVTPAELVAIYQHGITNSYTLLVDEAKQEIRFEMIWYDKFKQWLKRMLRL